MDAGTLPRPSLARGAARLAGVLTRSATAVGLIAVAALLVRLWQLDGKSLWFDEAYSVFIADQPFLQIPTLLRTYDTHPPFHYMLLHLWMGVFGSSEIAVRLPSVLAGVGTVVLTFLLGRKVAGLRVGLLAAALLAISPFQVMSAQEARMYPFLTLFAAGAAYALVIGLESGSRRAWIAYAAALILALATHHFAFLLLPAFGLSVAVGSRGKGKLRPWLLWTAVALVAYLPLLPLLLAQITTARGWPDIRPPFGLGALTDTLGMFSFGGGLFGMGTYFRRGSLPLEQRAAVLLPFLLLALCGVAALSRPGRRLMLSYWLVPVLLTAGVSLRWNIFYERYFSFVLPPFSILLAAGVFYLADALARPRRAVVVTALMLVFVAFNAPALAEVYRNTHPVYDWRGAARHVATQARPADFILYVPAFARIPFEYYFKGAQARMGLNPKEVLTAQQKAALGQLRLRSGVEPGRIAEIARRHPRMWIVSTIPIGYEARLRLAEILKPYFREVEGRTFGLAFTFLWESRLFTDEGR